jgi:L-aminopeptidase/D-esterase-like protein
MHNLITDIAGVTVGHATDLELASGVTVILFDRAVTASGILLGGAPGTRDTTLLDPGMTVGEVDAFVLSGGSAFGLDAAGGVQGALRAAGRGFQVGPVRVPIVPQAILMDLLNGGNKAWGRHSPYREMGENACLAASEDFALGSVGAGTGATTASVKGGLGSASAVSSKGYRIGAIAAVNALGSSTVGTGPHFWAAPFERENEFGGMGLPSPLSEEHTTFRLKGMQETATTIGAVVTDAALSKQQAYRLAIMAQDGIAHAILPAHLPLDGDTVFSAATGDKPLDAMADYLELCHLATTVMARAVARGVYEATTLPQAGAQPAWRDRFGA